MEYFDDNEDLALNFIHNLSDKKNVMSSELEKYISLLNPEQKAAVEHSDSPLLILAGAGSGKTRVITTKIAYLINQKNVMPHSILAVTFTKKAAKEMMDRAVKLEPRAQSSMIRTFHSFGSWFLRKYYEHAGIAKNFTVYDDDDMITLVSKAIPELNKAQASSVAHHISLAKDYCYLPDSPHLSDITNDLDFPRYYKLYQQRLRQTGNVDFGDLIMLPVLLLEQNEQIRFQMHYRFKVILVDEYQDSNVAQFRLLKVMTSYFDSSTKKDNLNQTYVCVVGDDDQSIYKFRGAEVQNILSFQNQFSNTTLIRLERNYRSTSEILSCADSVVSNNEDRLGKTLIAERGDGKKPVLVFLPDQDEEAKLCASMILQSHQKGCPFSDWAILYRTNAQSLTFESEFLHQKIPYQVVGSLKFYDREEIKDLLAFLSLVANPKDELSFRRIINKPARGIGNVAQDKIFTSAITDDGLINLIDACKLSINNFSKKAKEGISMFISLMDELNEKISSENKELKLSEFIELIMNKSGLLEHHKVQDEIAQTQKVSNMQELVNSAVLYDFSMKGLLEFLDHIELDRTVENDSEENADSVTLITIHNTKGLEFPRVVITGLEQGIFPRDNETSEEIEEERRLFYVGITRAKDELYITSCAQRRLYGRTNPMDPSRFLIELGENPFKVLGKKPWAFSSSKKDSFDDSIDYDDCRQGNFYNQNNRVKNKFQSPWCIGTRIYHDDYGYGQIVSSKKEEGNIVISVLFETGSVKRFLPEFQKSSLIIVKD
jgi:DNA helicase-2/ATP-dependent DNA helicase PcrA